MKLLELINSLKEEVKEHGNIDIEFKMFYLLCSPVTDEQTESIAEDVTIETNYRQENIHIGSGKHEVKITKATKCFINVFTKD